MSYTLHYFGLPGRAEVARLLCHTAPKKIAWVDKRHDFASWNETKASLKPTFGQLPCLALPDGAGSLAQSSAIDRYLAVKTGAEPKDEFAWARSDETYAFMEDVFQTLAPSLRMADEAQKIEAREAACAGPLREKLEMLDAHLAKLGGAAWFSGLDFPSYADYSCWHWLCVLRSEWLEGVPGDVWAKYPAIVAFHARVTALPGVVSWLALSENQDSLRQKGAAPVA